MSKHDLENDMLHDPMKDYFNSNNLFEEEKVLRKFETMVCVVANFIALHKVTACECCKEAINITFKINRNERKHIDYY